MGSPEGGPALEIAGLAKSYPTGVLHRGRRGVLEDLTLAVPREGLITALRAALESRSATTIRPQLRLVRTEAHDE